MKPGLPWIFKGLVLLFIVFTPYAAAWWQRLCWLVVFFCLYFYTYGALRLFRGGGNTVLDSVPISHYVEKIRWSLDRLGEPYEEDGHVAVLGILFEGRTVPALYVGVNTVLGDSVDIEYWLRGKLGHRAAFLEIPEQYAELKKKFDGELATSVRRWIYANTIDNTPLMMKIWGRRVPWYEAALLPYGLFSFCKLCLIRLLDLRRPGCSEKSLDKIKGVFAEVDALLSDGRRYLAGGESLTLLDISFCALGAAVVLAPEYKGTTPTLEECPPVLRNEMEKFRATRVGQYILRVYKEERDIILPKA